MKNMRQVLHEVLGEDLSPGEVLRGLRIESGMSQDQLYEITGVLRTNISALENGRIAMTANYAELFGIALRVHPADILYPNRKFEKNDELRKVEKKAAAFFRRTSTARG